MIRSFSLDKGVHHGQQTIGLIFAFIGIGATVIYIILGLMGINILKEIRDRLNDDA